MWAYLLGTVQKHTAQNGAKRGHARVKLLSILVIFKDNPIHIEEDAMNPGYGVRFRGGCVRTGSKIILILA